MRHRPERAPSDGLWAQWDADGNDRDDVNGEYVKIRNYDVNNWLPLTGWYLRDSGLRRFTFPPGSAIPPNGSVTVYAGVGEDSGTDFYWGLGGAGVRERQQGQPGHRRRRLPVRPSGQHPRLDDLPLQGRLLEPGEGLDRDERAAEEGRVRHAHRRGRRSIDLEPYVLKSLPYSYAFAQGTALAPGQTIRVHTQGDPSEDTATDQYWGMDTQILDNSGDVAELVDLQRRRDRLHRVRLEVLLSRSE